MVVSEDAPPIVVLAKVWAELIAASEQPALSSRRDGKLLRPVPKDSRLSQAALCKVLQSVFHASPWIADEARKLLKTRSAGITSATGTFSPAHVVPRKAQVAFFRCWAYMTAGNFHQALKDSRVAIAESPKERVGYFCSWPAALAAAGATLAGLSEFPQAAVYFAQAVELEPNEFLQSELSSLRDKLVDIHIQALTAGGSAGLAAQLAREAGNPSGNSVQRHEGSGCPDPDLQRDQNHGLMVQLPAAPPAEHLDAVTNTSSRNAGCSVQHEWGAATEGMTRVVQVGMAQRVDSSDSSDNFEIGGAPTDLEVSITLDSTSASEQASLALPCAAVTQGSAWIHEAMSLPQVMPDSTFTFDQSFLEADLAREKIEPCLTLPPTWWGSKSVRSRTDDRGGLHAELRGRCEAATGRLQGAPCSDRVTCGSVSGWLNPEEDEEHMATGTVRQCALGDKLDRAAVFAQARM